MRSGNLNSTVRQGNGAWGENPQNSRGTHVFPQLALHRCLSLGVASVTQCANGVPHLAGSSDGTRELQLKATEVRRL